MTIRSQGNYAAVRERLKAVKTQRVKQRGRQLQGITRDMHRDAPRGGIGINMFGEQRSAPGEPPAMETGALFALIDQGLEQVNDSQVRITVNYAVQEDGTLNMLPRPLGRQAIAELQRQVNAE